MIKLIRFKVILVATNKLKYYVLKKYSKFILFAKCCVWVLLWIIFEFF